MNSFKFEDDASFDGIKIRLYTNIDHIHDFWTGNWFDACPDMRPHVHTYVVDDGGKFQIDEFFEKPAEQPEINAGVAYNPETKTTIVLNTDYCDETKPISLAMAADIARAVY